MHNNYDDGCPVEGVERTTTAAYPPQVDPLISMLVSYAERAGRAESDSRHQSNAIRMAQQQAEVATQKLRHANYAIEDYKAVNAKLNEYAHMLEKKIPKKKVVKKVAKKTVKKGGK